jgi:hypothetical protein
MDGVSLWARHGNKIFASSAAIAGLIGLLLMVFPSLYFNSWMVWQDWYTYLFSENGKLLYSVSSGNFSTRLIVSNALNINSNVTMILIVIILVTLVLWVLLRQRTAKEPVTKFLWEATTKLLQDPYLSAALGITVTLAISPLVWWHYYTLSLFPSLWLIVISPKWGYAKILGLLSIMLTSAQFLLLLGWDNYLPYIVACGWIPLWFGLVIEIKGRFPKSSVQENIDQIRCAEIV